MERVETIKGNNVVERLLQLLKDGKYHHRLEIAEAVGCEFNMVSFHVCMARKQLDEDEEIVCEFVRRKTGYRMVKLYKKSEFENLIES